MGFRRHGSIQVSHRSWGLVLGAFFVTVAFAADVAPDPAIKFKVTIDGRSTVGLVDLSGSPGSIKPLTPERKRALGKAFEAALIPVKIGAKVPISVIVSRADGSTQNVNQDPRLYVDSTLTSLKFDRSGFLTIRETPGMPKIDPGDILTLHLFFFPDRDNHEHFGYDELYIRATQ